MKKKGFTLIELLAVIIILAILAFILIPIIQDLIANARYGAAANSVMNYVNAANTQAAVEAGGFEEYKLNLSDTYELDSEIDTEELDKIKYKGKGPTYVYLLFSGEEKYVSEGHFCMWGYSIDYNFETGTSKSDLDYCGGEGTEPEGDPTCDVLRNNKYDDTEVFKINNVEDLVCVSEISKTKTFENKTIYLIKDIDFNEDKSYQNINDTSFGDINGNGEVEGLKTELTTGKGFNPIGTFKGTFEGYAKSISNLMVNRPQERVGLFSTNQGKIQGFEISSNITGSSIVGGVVGYNDGGTINEIIYTGEVHGSNYLGGVVGKTKNGTITSILVRNVTIPGAFGVGGILGGQDANGFTLSGVVERGTLSVSNNTVGKIAGNGVGTQNGYGSTSVSLSGRVYSSSGVAYILGSEMLNTYDKVLDTYIGGDNDNSGYYFDYENEDSSNIVIKRTDKNPIKFTVKGNGTESSPYIIDSVQHYKEASTLAGKEGNYKLKITKDIDFTGRHYYALGTNGNSFSSDIDGDMHTISNISITCAENCGLISKNDGHTIEGLNLNNISISSANSIIGGFIGYNLGTIKGITASNVTISAPGVESVGGLVGINQGTVAAVKMDTVSITADSYVGGVVGKIAGGEISSALVKNVTIPGKFQVGGILGGQDTTEYSLKGVVESGTLSVSNNTVGRVSGTSGGTQIGYGSTSVSISGRVAGNHGTEYVLGEEVINIYDHALDTWIGGDEYNDGYYFDYENDSSSNIVVKRTKDAPITFTLSGNGTTENPFIIDSYQHYKEATTLLADAENNYKFKFTADIDFNGKHYYSLGTFGNPLAGDIDGDMHTLSNISINCTHTCGLLNENIGHTIEGLNLKNITVASSYDVVGGFVGHNTGIIKGMNVDNINVTGFQFVGGLVGLDEGTISEIAIDDATVECHKTAGGLVGKTNDGTIKSVLVKNATVSTFFQSGGILGGQESDTTEFSLTGVVEKGSMSVTDNSVGKVAGTSNGTISSYASNLAATSGRVARYNGTAYTLIPPTTVSVSGEEVDSLTYYDSVGVLDTVIGGDNDNSGYYLQYNDSADSIIVVKAGTPSNPSNPGNPNPDSPVPITGTPTGTNPPTCVLNQVIPRSNGIQAVLTCEDEEGAPTIRSQWNVNAGAPTNTFADIGIVKNGTVNGNSKTVRPYWSTSDPISVPHRGDCYYYRFGAQDASGNWTYYVTNECYHAFLD